ncbi:plastocyanin/azurin family copper-binding protein [Saccharococcus caldoxylosilyticus]|uniref:plastocyanin/azurin family copper-binding protein n=1 Tax=Saccharococcus caldoxylosilyticus TaxID=81408 RepID=UPI00030355A9|nr:plastocyanin/azurin family copper-binding protein [Parageobacillus caldoxylosilyticus]
MSILLTGIIVTILSLIVIVFVFIKRKKITYMIGMMVAMALGMLVGLTGGLVAGILYSGNLFFSTVLGMGFGFLAGFLTGLPISVMAIIDGVLSGIMGGMMGAMLGEMISPEYQNTMIHIMLVIFVGMIGIVLYMLQQEIGFNRLSFINKIFHNPLLLSIVFLLFFYTYNHLYNELAQDHNMPIKNSHMSHSMTHNKSSVSPLNSSTKTKKVVIEATEFAYFPQDFKLTVGQPVTLILKNSGKVEHDIEFENMKASLLQQSHHGNHLKNQTVHIHSLPGKTAEVKFIPIENGVFRFYCTVPGHKESGMVGFVEVF